MRPPVGDGCGCRIGDRTTVEGIPSPVRVETPLRSIGPTMVLSVVNSSYGLLAHDCSSFSASLLNVSMGFEARNFWKTGTASGQRPISA